MVWHLKVSWNSLNKCFFLWYRDAEYLMKIVFHEINKKNPTTKMKTLKALRVY